MNRIRVLAIVLIALGILGLVYDKVTYTSDSHDLEIGSVELSVKEKETVNVPLWCSVGAIAAGAILLLVRKRG